MLKKGIVISLLIFVCSVFFYCSSMEWKEWKDNKDYYLIRYLSNYSFKKYHLISMMNYDHQIFHVLSKEMPKNEKSPFEKYKRIKHGFYYKVIISKIDSIIVLKSMFNIRARGSIVLSEKINDETIIIWSDDTLRVPAYTSENIYGFYVEILE